MMVRAGVRLSFCGLCASLRLPFLLALYIGVCEWGGVVVA